tara:strand:+ start:412 stop:1326 length:915 start_codon:yes stop_codon:yes gene_type:complete
MKKDFPIDREFIEANGLRFEVDTCGSGDILALCLHGFPENSFSWRYQLPMLAKKGFKAWAPNLRGYGNSSKPVGIHSYSLENLMADVAALIDVSRCKNIVLIGHDWGAVIAWFFTMRKIRKLDRLIICNVPHPAKMDLRRNWSQLRKSWYIFFFQLPRIPEMILGAKNAKLVGQMIKRSSSSPSMFPSEVIDKFTESASQPGSLEAMINYYRGLIRGGGMRRQAQLGFPLIDIPTLMIWGEEDVALSKKTTLGTDEFVTDLTLRYLPRVSHWCQQEQPDIVNLMISNFIDNERVPELSWEPRFN